MSKERVALPAHIVRWIAGLSLAVAAIVLAGLAHEWLVLRSVERTFGTLRGEIRTGGVVDIRVGQTWEEADSALRRNFKPDYVQWSNGCSESGKDLDFADGPILNGRAEVYYRDRSSRNGGVFLCLTDGVVNSIGWSFSGPLFVDL